MKRFLITVVLFVLVVIGTAKVMAQSTEPGLGLPLLDDDPTAVATAIATATTAQSATVYSTIAPTTATTVTAITALTTSQSAVDDAETGSEVIVLVILSITGGVGIFLIKKYFDFKRYSI